MFFPDKTSAQEYSYYSFNKLYDFDVSVIYDIHQDSANDFWFGTNQGLVHFNGRDFHKYAPGNYSKDVTNVKFDKDGNVWCSNFSGQLFALKNDSLHTIVEKTSEGNFISDYLPIGNEVFFILNKNKSLYTVNLSTLQTEQIWKVEERRCISSILDDEHELRIIVQARVTKNTLNIKQFSFDLKQRRIKHLSSTSEINYPSSSLWTLRLNDSIYHIAITKSLFSAFNITRKNPLLFKEKVQSYDINNLELHNDQLLALRKTCVQAYTLTKPYTSNTIISAINASCFYADHERNLWFGTLDEGIYIVPNEAIKKTPLTESRISNSIITNDKTLYFVDTDGQLCKSKYPYFDFSVVSGGFTPSEKLVYAPDVNTLFFSNHNQCFDINKNTLQPQEGFAYFKDIHYLDAEHFILTNGQYAKLQTTRNVLDVSKLSGYNFHDLTSYENVRDLAYLRFTRSTDVIESPNRKHLYIHYIDGVYHYTADVPPEAIQFQGTSVLARVMHPGVDKSVWIATNNTYLLKYEGRKLVYQRKLPSEVHRIAQDGNLLFLVADKKIYRLNVLSNELSVIDESDGLIPTKISSVFCHNDSLFVVGGSFVQRIPCSYDYVNDVVPNVTIDGVYLNGQVLPSNKFLFDHDQNNLTFSFHALSIRSQQNYYYEYRISEDAEWVSLSGSVTEVLLQSLEPGSYVFQIRVINEDGTPSAIKRYPFVIDKHFSQKWWFVLLVVIGLALLVGVVVRYRYKNLQRQNVLKAEQQRLKKEVYKSKIAAIRSQMNPHFMFNALNTIQEFIITNQREIASEYLADFADLMRKYLEQSRHEEIAIAEEIETLEIYLSLENLRFDGNLNYSVHCEPTINPFETTIPVMLLQPFVENAIKHGLLHQQGKKALTIRFSENNTRLQCTIEDNGIGRKASLQMKKGGSHVSFATEAIDQKTDLVNKSSSRNIFIRIEDLMSDDKPQGTRVIITLDV